MGEKWGDRRQELVFIGVGLEQSKIESILDEALLTGLSRESSPPLVALCCSVLQCGVVWCSVFV